MNWPLTPLLAAGGAELTVLLLGLVPVVLVWGGLYWLHRDGKRRDVDHPLLWPVGVFIGLNLLVIPGLVVLAAYFHTRPDVPAPDDDDDVTLDKNNDPYLKDEIENNVSRD